MDQYRNHSDERVVIGQSGGGEWIGIALHSFLKANDSSGIL